MSEEHIYQIVVSVPVPIHKNFNYLFSEKIPIGTRVLVPFGRRKLVGVVVGIESSLESKPAIKLKEVEEVLDESPIYSSALLDIANWLSGYYLYPLGEVLRTMFPLGVEKVKKRTYLLTDLGKKFCQEELEEQGQLRVALLQLFNSKKSLAEGTIKAKIKKLGIDKSLLSFSIKQGYVEEKKDNQVKARKSEASGLKDSDEALSSSESLFLPLTDAQEDVLNTILKDNPPVKPFLLYGVTGSGKTEIYLHIIRSLFSDNSNDQYQPQALVMVPEISLTPQMTRIFEVRFPNRVAVVHSAMTDTQRWRELSRIRSGEARVLIGPRSAVFAPFKNLKLIVVDEEHDGSYKQTTGLHYNARDVAVLRGKKERALVILGSATPSMESYQNGLSEKYQLIKLLERVQGRALPGIDTVTPQAGKKFLTFRGDKKDQVFSEEDLDLPIHPKILESLRQNFQEKKQAMVIVNRRGYAYYLFSMADGKAVECPNCSISLTIHKRMEKLRCHYCDYQTSVDSIIKKNPNKHYAVAGYGSQQVEQYLQQEIPGASIVRIDSDTVSRRDVLSQTLDRFRQGDVDILVGTQILAKGHDFPNVTLIVLLEIDQNLNLPDFRSGERAFQLFVQSAGRAGRAQLSGRVIIQTAMLSHPVIQAGLNHDYLSFVEKELSFRKNYGYPPFRKLVWIEFSSRKIEKLVELEGEIKLWLRKQRMDGGISLVSRVQVLGPSVPPIEIIRGYIRRGILLMSSDISLLIQFCRAFMQRFQAVSREIRIRVDVDPQSLL